MATAVWPAFVTMSVLRQGYSEEDEDNGEEFQPEKGPPITWLSPSAETTLYHVVIECSTAQKAVLKEFRRDRLGNGKLPFTRPDPSTGEIAEFMFASSIVWSEIAVDIHHGVTALRRMP